MEVQFYLLFGIDPLRGPFMLNQFDLFGIDRSKVKWVLKPNKDDDLPSGICTNPSLTRGQIAVTFKHFLALRDIADNGHELAVIMEDNILFYNHVPTTINRYLSHLPDDWGILFDSDTCNLHYIEGPVSPQQSVYRKSLEVTEQCNGGSRGANFVLVNHRTAKLLAENFLPFNNVSDYYYNHLLRKFRIPSFWPQPNNVHHIPRPSTWRIP